MAKHIIFSVLHLNYSEAVCLSSLIVNISKLKRGLDKWYKFELVFKLNSFIIDVVTKISIINKL